MNTSPASSHCGESASDTPHPIETLLHDVSEEMRSIAKEAQAASCLVTETIGTLEAKLKAKREKLLDSIDKLCWSQLDVCESKQRRLFALQEKHATFVQISQQLIGGQVSDTDTILLADSVARNHDIVVREMRSERGTAARRKIAAVCTSIDTINDDFDALLSIEVEPAMSFDLPPLPPDINSDGIQLTLGIDRPVDVVWVSSPCRVWCQAITDEEAWGTVTTQLSHLHTHPVAVADGPTVGSIYAAHHARYGEWYRARVLAVNNDSCLVSASFTINTVPFGSFYCLSMSGRVCVRDCECAFLCQLWSDSSVSICTSTCTWIYVQFSLLGFTILNL